ncbi:MAG: MFS transporter [Rhizobiaceae bacterium]|nr:MFS transporter [Rhizobiaceae bacterium]
MAAQAASGLSDPRKQTLNPGDIAIGVIIGRTSEYFDFFVYAIASVVVFPKLIFPHHDPVAGTLYSFAIFSLAFIARPIGTTIFMSVDRVFGRGVKMTIALFMLGTSTVLIGFLPGYDTIGPTAIVVLCVLRIGQGLALGGTWDGLAPLLSLNVPEKRRGWYAMIPQLGAPLGLMIASALFAYFISILSPEDFLSWGWRYPFFVAFAVNVVALFARLRIVVAKEFMESFAGRYLEPQPVFRTLRAEGGNVVVGTFAPLASLALFHMVTVFPLSWVFIFTTQDTSRFLVITLIAAAFGVAAILASGPLADRYGRRTLLGAGAVAIAAFSGFAPQLLDGGDVGEAIFMILGFVLLGISFGQSSGSVASNFAPQNRYTASAITSDLAWLFGAGFAPFVALFLSSNFGLLSTGAYLLSGAACTLIALLTSSRLDRAER